MSSLGAADHIESSWTQSRSPMQFHARVEANARGERPLEAFLADWLASGPAAETRRSGDRSMDRQIPLPIQVTLDQLLELADETELRALTLAWMTHSFQVGQPSPRKQQTLLQITAELRRMAERLRTEVWLGATGS